MADREDTSEMTEKQILSRIYNTVEVLDDIVRGDVDRGSSGLQADVKEMKNDISKFKQAKLVRQTIITSIASLVTVLASLATIISLAWQGSGG